MEHKTIKEMTVPVHRILKMSEMVKDLNPDTKIGFMYIISFLFPSAWNNIQDALKEEHTKGYMEGYNDKN